MLLELIGIVANGLPPKPFGYSPKWIEVGGVVIRGLFFIGRRHPFRRTRSGAIGTTSVVEFTILSIADLSAKRWNSPAKPVEFRKLSCTAVIDPG